MPCLSWLWLKLRGEQGSGPKGVNDLCFHTYGGFSPPPPPSPHPPSPQPPGPYISLEAHISALRPISQPQSTNPSLEAQIPWGWNLGLKVGIWALRLGFGPKDWDLGLENEIWASRLGGVGVRRRRRRKVPICVKAEVIDPSGPLPKKGTDQPTNQPTDRPTDKAGCRVA